MAEKRYVVRECPFCYGGRELLPSAGTGTVQGECGRCDGSGKSRAFLYPKPKGWRGPWPPPVPSRKANRLTKSARPRRNNADGKICSVRP